MVSLPVALLALLHVAVVVSCLIVGCTYYVTYHYGPEAYPAFEGAIGKEDRLPECGASTHDVDDLFVDGSFALEEAESVLGKHGVAIIEEILTHETATRLRDYILKANHEVEHTHVPAQENRYRIMISHENPLVQAALKEVALHPVFRPLLDGAIGPSGSLVSMSAITNVYGAKAQHFHADTHTSAASHPDHFVPEIQLGIPLQNMTRGMGATEICPGTHKCSTLELDWEYYYHKFMREEYPDVTDYEVDIEDREYNKWVEYEGGDHCDVVAAVEAGSGILFNTDTIHRGGAHTDPDGPERVVIFLTFAGSRRGPGDTRSLPLGKVHALHWKSWGHTIDDFETVDSRPWSWWHVFGFRFFATKNGVRPWCIHDIFFEALFKQPGSVVHMIHDDFDLYRLHSLLERWICATSAATVAYLVILPFAWLLATGKRGTHVPTAGSNEATARSSALPLKKLLSSSIETKDCCNKDDLSAGDDEGSRTDCLDKDDDGSDEDDGNHAMLPSTPTKGRGGDVRMDKPRSQGGSSRKNAALAVLLIGMFVAFLYIGIRLGEMIGDTSQEGDSVRRAEL